jgi:hypothetical protein
MFDELKIMITGDVSGIDKSIKQAFNIIQGGVSKMNDQEVDWTSIFARSVSPAVISGVASMFAYAISQAINFQQAMATTGTAAGFSGDQIGQLSQASLTMSKTVPASAEELATAMTQVSAIFGDNTQATQDITQAMAELSASGFGPLNDIVKTSMELFRQYGVTTEAGAIQVLTDLMHGAEGAKESIPDLANQFSDFAKQLPGADKTLEGFNGQLSSFAGTIQALGVDSAVAQFNALAASANSAAGPMEILGTSGLPGITKALQSGNVVGLLDKTATLLERMGPGAALVAQGFGFAGQAVDAFQTRAKNLPAVDADTKNIATNTQTISQAYDQSSSALRVFQEDWNRFKASMIDIGKLFTPLAEGLANALATMSQDLDTFFSDLTGPKGLGGVLSDLFGGKFQDALKTWGDTVSGAVYNATVKPGAQLLAAASGAYGNQTAQLNALLLSQGFTDQGTLNRIDQSAQQNGLMGSLISALQTGGSGDQYSSTINHFNLTLPQGVNGWTPKDLANALYQKFQGTQ